MNQEPMSNQELVDAAIALAGEFYAMQGYTHRPGFKYWQSPHPHERLCFDMACRAFEIIRGSDVMSAVDDLEDE
ncbi:hypothetical protein [Leclercia sp.]|uniref:hypothetical protein n=1 Tax=Leclercia sp. TaxID=1898428 RepID=UPI0028BD431C|nr:hypothetical protein [Leclercia sp.]